MRAAAEAVERDVEQRREAELVARLQEAVVTGGRGVAGLAPTLDALSEHRVERLVVSKGYSQAGWRCPETGALASVGPNHPASGQKMDRVEDVVEDAIEEALTQGVPVTICVGNADLDVLGRIGALLRYWESLGALAGARVGMLSPMLAHRARRRAGPRCWACWSTRRPRRRSSPRSGSRPRTAASGLVDTLATLARSSAAEPLEHRRRGAGPRRSPGRAAASAPTCGTCATCRSRPSCAARTGVRVEVDNDATCHARGRARAPGPRRAPTMRSSSPSAPGSAPASSPAAASLRGANGFAGEPGHMIVDPNGPPCPCGQRGCWERFASGTGLARLARDAAHGGRLDAAVALGRRRPRRGAAASTSPPPRAPATPRRVAVLGELAHWIALGLANLVNLLDPAVIVIGGGLVDAADLLLPEVRARVGDLALAGRQRPEVRIVPAALGERAGAIGAALLAAGDPQPG